MARRKKLDKFWLFNKIGYTPHKGQLEIHLSNHPRKICAAGVRSGKTQGAAMEALWAALAGTTKDALCVVWCVSNCPLCGVESPEPGPTSGSLLRFAFLRHGGGTGPGPDRESWRRSIRSIFTTPNLTPSPYETQKARTRGVRLVVRPTPRHPELRAGIEAVRLHRPHRLPHIPARQVG